MKTLVSTIFGSRLRSIAGVAILVFSVFYSPPLYALSSEWQHSMDGIEHYAGVCGSGGSGSSNSNSGGGSSTPADPDGWTYPTVAGAPITGEFHEDRGSYAHRGVDIGAPDGSPIYASREGTVVAAGPAQGFGNWVVIEHEENGKKVSSVYGHMRGDTITVKAGDKVSAGQQIASVGSEGQSSGPHLHYEEWDGGRSGGTERKPVAVYGGQAAGGATNDPNQAAASTTPQPNSSSSTECCEASSGGGSSTPLAGSDNAERVWNYLKEHGLSDEQVAGIMGNLAHEAGDPTFNQATKAVEAGSGAGFGLMQWTGSRRGQIESAAQREGKELTDLQFQLDYMVEESKGRTALNGGNEWDELKNQKSLEDATRYWMDNAERPGVPHFDRRLELAKQYLEKYAGKSGGTSSGSTCSSASKNV